jgi:uncharacterized protein YeaO (DUF488 family)
LDLFTIQLSKWWQARSRDIILLDTTVKTGTSVFAPTWEMVMGYKQGVITWDEYTQQYYNRMNASWKSEKDRPVWLGTIESTEPLAIACMCRYEGPHTHCHRFLLKELFEKLCERRGIPFYYYGELTDAH